MPLALEPIGLTPEVSDTRNIETIIEAMRMASRLDIEYLTALTLLEASGW